MAGLFGGIPFSKFDGTLKFHSPGNVPPICSAAVDFACPAFSDISFYRDAHKATRENLRKEALEIFEQKGFDTIDIDLEPKARRYAADLTLPRGAYYGVCVDETGQDRGAVANEMMAYRIPEKTGHTWVFDCFDPAVAQNLGMERKRAFLIRIGEVDLFRKRYPQLSITVGDDGVLAVEVPYRVERRRIDKCIDLRLPATRDWFFRKFRLGDGKLFSKPRGTNVSGFLDMLPALMKTALGGGDETRGIGNWMRHSGVNALVFPSARCDVGVIVRNAKVVEHYGWNLVDFRDAPRPVSDSIIDISPWCAEILIGARYRFTKEGAGAGSFDVGGVEALHRDLFRARLGDFAK